MLNLQIGHGLPEPPQEFEGGFLEAQLSQEHARLTLAQLGRAFAKQLGIVDGEVQIQSVFFTWQKQKKQQ